MIDRSRGEFIRMVCRKGLGLYGAVNLSFFPHEKPDTVKVDTKTRATPKLYVMPSVDQYEHVYERDDAPLRARKDAPVAVVKSVSASEAAYNVLDLLEPHLRADRVFIKANYSTYPFADSGVPLQKREYYYMGVTQPEFIYGIIHYLHDQGISYQNITVGDGIGNSTTDRLTYMGLFDQAKKIGFRVLDITRDSIVGYRLKQADLLTETGCSKVVSDHLFDGVVISAPKLKCHPFTTFTLSLKNMMGVILPSDKKFIMHAEFHNFKDRNRETYIDTIWYFSRRLIDLYALAPDFSVVDGVIGGEGNGVANMYKGKQVTFPVESHRAFASINSLNLDAVCGYFMGHNPMVPKFEDLPEFKFIPWLYLGQKKKYGYMYVKRINILGDQKLIEPEHKYNLSIEAEYESFMKKKG